MKMHRFRSAIPTFIVAFVAVGVLFQPLAALADCLADAKAKSVLVTSASCVADEFTQCSDPKVGGIPVASNACPSGQVCCGFVGPANSTGCSGTNCTGPDTSPRPTTFKLYNPLGAGSTFYTVIQNVISAFLGMVGALALGVFIYAGVTWMTAGSSDRVQKAKDAMKYAVIGLALIAFAYAITTFFINSLTGGIQAQSQAQQAAQQKAAATPPAVNP